MSFLPGEREKIGHVSETDLHQTPATGMAAPAMLYTGIVLYSAGDPEASAMLVADGLIAWTGPEDTARVLHSDVQQVDATGCLITPGFVDAAATADGSAPDPAGDVAAAALGIVLRLPGPTGLREGVRVVAPVSESADYLDLLTDGTPLAFASAGEPAAADPWDWVRGAARTSPAEQRISDRAQRVGLLLRLLRQEHRVAPVPIYPVVAGPRQPFDLLSGAALLVPPVPAAHASPPLASSPSRPAICSRPFSRALTM